VRLNELLALNDTAALRGGLYPDLIELHNPGDSAIEMMV